MIDSELLDQFHSGSQGAFSELVQRHLAWVHASALRRTRDPHMADDVAQAVFIALAQSKRVPKGAAMSAWMFRVAQNASANLLRSERRRNHHERAAARQAARSVQSFSDQRELLNKYLDRAVERLAKPDLQAVLLRFYEHKSVAEVGAALGISEEGAKKRLTRAIAKLRTSLVKDGITIPADALSAAVQVATALPAGSAPACMAHTIARSSLHVSQGTRAAAIAKSAIASFGSAGSKVAAAVALAVVILVPATAIIVVVASARSQPAVSPFPAPIPASKSAPSLPATPSPSPAALEINDRLKVTIGDLVGPGRWSVYTPLVDPDGTITMPLIAPIQVRGASPAEIQERITRAYGDANLIGSALSKVERIEDGNSPLTGRGALKAGDAVVCHITDLESPGIESRLPRTITADGGIELPHLGNRQIAGKSESAAAIQIARAYRDANLISNAQVELVRQLPPSVSLAPSAVDANAGALPHPVALSPTTGAMTAPAGATTAQILQLWETVRTNRQIALRAIRNFDAHFTHTSESFALDLGNTDPIGMVRHVHLIESSEKYFEQSTSDLIGPGTTSNNPMYRAMAFDGRIGWFRQTQEVGTVTYGTSARMRQKPLINPLDFMGFAEPARLQKRLDAGDLKLSAAWRAEQSGKPVINIQIVSREKSRLFI